MSTAFFGGGLSVVFLYKYTCINSPIIADLPPCKTGNKLYNVYIPNNENPKDEGENHS